MKQKFNHRVAFTVCALLAVFAVVAAVLHRTHSQSSCVLLMPIKQSQTLIDHLDHSTADFASTTTELMGQTTEGGVQFTFTKGSARQIVEQRLYGETGHSYVRVYYSSQRPFALVSLDMQYRVPISVDISGAIKSQQERDYFLDANGNVCYWTVNGVSQPVDKDTIDLMHEFMSGIK